MGAGLLPVPAGAEQAIVVRVDVANVSVHGQSNRLAVEALGLGCPSNSPRILAAGVFRDRDGFWLWTAWVESANAPSKLIPVMRVELSVTLRTPLTHACPSVGIRETLLFGARQRILLNEDSLAFVALPSATKADHDRFQGRIAAGPPGQSCVAAGEEDEVSQVGARETERTLAFEAQPSPLAELLAALGAG